MLRHPGGGLMFVCCPAVPWEACEEVKKEGEKSGRGFGFWWLSNLGLASRDRPIKSGVGGLVAHAVLTCSFYVCH